MSEMQLNPSAVGAAFSKLRKQKHMTQEVLSGMADIGRTHLSAIERGERKPTMETVWRVAAALRIRPSKLVAEIEREAEKLA